MAHRRLLLALLASFSAALAAGCAARDVGSPGSEVGEAVRVLFEPSFDPPFYVTASADPTPHVVLSTPLTEAAWDQFAGAYRRFETSAPGRRPPMPSPPAGPAWHVETVIVSAERWRAFRDEVATADPPTLGDVMTPGLLDGVTIGVEYRAGDGRTNAFVYHGDDGFPRHERVIDAVCRLMADHLRDPRSLKVAPFTSKESKLPPEQPPGTPPTTRPIPISPIGPEMLP